MQPEHPHTSVQHHEVALAAHNNNIYSDLGGATISTLSPSSETFFPPSCRLFSPSHEADLDGHWSTTIYETTHTSPTQSEFPRPLRGRHHISRQSLTASHCKSLQPAIEPIRDFLIPTLPLDQLHSGTLTTPTHPTITKPPHRTMGPKRKAKAGKTHQPPDLSDIPPPPPHATYHR